MKLCFLRHGEADWPNWNKPDDERPLTERGRKEMKRVAKFLERLKFSANAILTSPLPRASQTAEIVAERLGIELKTETRRLRHGSWSRARVFRSDQGAHRRRSEVIEGRRSAAGGKSRVHLRQIALAFSTEIFEGSAVAQPSWLWGQRASCPLNVAGQLVGAAQQRRFLLRQQRID